MVKWELTNTANETVGDVAIITKTLVGHVDNSSYPHGAGHTPNPNWPYFLGFAEREFKISPRN
jgi:hypothetical protein